MARTSMIEYKFILDNIQSLVCDSRGRFRYIDQFDTVIKDIFGVRHLARNINSCVDNRDIIAEIDSVGAPNLIELFESRQVLDSFAELIAVAYRLRELQKQLQKQSKKSGRRDKRDENELKYLKKLYSDTIRYYQRRFGISNPKKMYKKRYRNLESLRDGIDFGFEDGFSSLLDDDWDDYDDPYGYNEDDGFGALERYRQKLTRRYPNERRRSYRDSRGFDIDDEEDDLDPSLDGDLYDRVDRLTDVVTDLSSAVQTITAKTQYDRAALRRNRMRADTPTIFSDNNQLPPVAPVPSADPVVSDLQQQTAYLTSQMNQIANGQRDITNFLKEIMTEDESGYDEDEDLGGFSKQEALYRYNQGPDPYQVEPGERMSRADVIDMINQQQPPAEGASVDPSSSMAPKPQPSTQQ